MSCATPESSILVSVQEEVADETIPDGGIVGESEVFVEGQEENIFEQSSSLGSQTYTEDEVVVILRELSESYDVPLWFLKAIIHRESGFNVSAVNMDDSTMGEENWNSQKEYCAFTSDGYPHGLGLTQLTGWMYQGSPYPYCLEEPDDENKEYYYSMRKQDFGEWISMGEVSVLENPFDPKENVERFLSGYAVPAFKLFASQYTEESEEEIWRRVAFHWNKGLYAEYDAENTDYLALYDQYVEEYKE